LPPKKLKNITLGKKPTERPMLAIPNEGTRKQRKRKILEFEEDAPLNSVLEEEEEVTPLINKHKKAGNPKKNPKTLALGFKQNLVFRCKEFNETRTEGSNVFSENSLDYEIVDSALEVISQERVVASALLSFP